MDNRINIISDSDGKQIVEQYLKEYIGDCYEAVETSDQIFISSDFPGELKGSDDTRRLFGTNAKAKFTLPVYNSNTGELDRFNVFRIEMLIRHAADRNLYDMVNIKKETSTPLEQ